MSLDIWAAATALFVASFTPGPNNAICASIGATYGYTRALPFALGVTVGYPALIAAVGLGLAVYWRPSHNYIWRLKSAAHHSCYIWLGKSPRLKTRPPPMQKCPGFGAPFFFSGSTQKACRYHSVSSPLTPTPAIHC